MSSSPPPIPPPRYVFVAYGWKWIIRSPVRVIRLVRYTYVFRPPRGRNTGRGLMASFPSWRRRQKKPHPKKNDFSHLLFCNTMPLGGASPPLTKRLCKNFTANFCQFPSPWLPILFLHPPPPFAPADTSRKLNGEEGGPSRIAQEKKTPIKR